MVETGKIIAKIIRDARKRKRIGQGELAELVGAHPQTMNKIERGEIVFSRFFPSIERVLELKPGTLTSFGPKKVDIEVRDGETKTIKRGRVKITITVDDDDKS